MLSYVREVFGLLGVDLLDRQVTNHLLDRQVTNHLLDRQVTDNPSPGQTGTVVH